MAKTIIPIGDSYYIGNAKVGNGLGMHLVYIDDLTKTRKLFLIFNQFRMVPLVRLERT